MLCIALGVLFGCNGSVNQASSQGVDSQGPSSEAASQNYYGSEGPIDQAKMDGAISEYLLLNTRYKITDRKFEAHEIYGIDQKEDEFTVYLYNAVIGYSFIDGTLKADAGGNEAARMELSLNQGQYEVTDYEPFLESDTVKDIFPEEYANKALTEDHKDLHASIAKQAEAWLKANGRTESVVGFGPAADS